MKKDIPVIEIFSFGYQRSGIPAGLSEDGGGFVFDCRLLPNPGREREFAFLSGLNEEVKSYLRDYPEVEEFLNNVFRMVDGAVRSCRERGFGRLQVCFGCTGGQHRSVYCAERLAAHLTGEGTAVRVTHLEKGIWW